MKKQRVISLSLVCLLAFGVLLALLTCTINVPDSSGGGGNDGGGGAITSLSGRYYRDDSSYSYQYITFRADGSFTADDGWTTTGSYTISGNRLRLSEDYHGRNWTIIDSTTLKDGDGGDYWIK
jgi:hypothetical protein